MTPPSAVGSEDQSDEFVDKLTDQLFESGAPGTGSDSDEDEDSGKSDAPPNFWQGPINTGPVSFDKPVDTPVTSGGDATGDTGVVDTGPSQ
jgi:hypothetical protein